MILIFQSKKSHIIKKQKKTGKCTDIHLFNWYFFNLGWPTTLPHSKETLVSQDTPDFALLERIFYKVRRTETDILSQILSIYSTTIRMNIKGEVKGAQGLYNKDI